MARRQTIDAMNSAAEFDSDSTGKSTGKSNTTGKPGRRLSADIARCVTDVAKDATYITIGFGLLALRQAQVQRREFERSRRD